tara:strand:+ start:716 stop:1891 length:1176 start_codon:yes stop_codon:yes gene_type:complete
MQTLSKTPVSSKIKEKKYKCNVTDYSIWNYDPNHLCFDEHPEVTQCRSVIFTSNAKQLLSISPRRSSLKVDFCRKYDASSKNMYINEYIDGTMIHLFYDKRINAWEIATKGAVGGNYLLFNKSTGKHSRLHVRQMFMDALVRDENSELSISHVLNHFPKHVCFTFVLLHPENLILFPETTPTLYITSANTINNSNRMATNIPLYELQAYDFMHYAPTILFPKVSHITHWNELDDNHCQVAGYVATDVISGERCTFHSKTYRELKTITHYEPVQLYTFLCAKQMNLIQKFTTIIPSFRKTFSKFQTHLTQFTDELHTAYLSKYVWRTFNTQFRMDTKYSKYVDMIHRDIYVRSIHTRSKTIITKQVIRKFLLERPPAEILNLCYFPMRKYGR